MDVSLQPRKGDMDLVRNGIVREAASAATGLVANPVKLE